MRRRSSSSVVPPDPSVHFYHCVRKVVDHFVNGGSTVNVCLLDLSKAFDKMNHYAFFIKLMNRSIPIQALSVLENWFYLCLSVVCQMGFCYVILL